jgi:predicted nucleic acid-binding Zn ribbon protein
MSDDEESVEETNESVSVYLRLKQLFGGTQGGSPQHRRRRPTDETDASRMPFGAGRDPRELGNVMDSLTAELGWNPLLAQSSLLAGWADIVGVETAEHSDAETIVDGVLMVRCSSTAWAAQLRTMKVDLLTELVSRFPDAGVQSIRFRGPDAPSWKRGPRSIPGRGPRDTYG